MQLLIFALKSTYCAFYCTFQILLKLKYTYLLGKQFCPLKEFWVLPPQSEFFGLPSHLDKQFGVKTPTRSLSQILLRCAESYFYSLYFLFKSYSQGLFDLDIKSCLYLFSSQVRINIQPHK